MVLSNGNTPEPSRPVPCRTVLVEMCHNLELPEVRLFLREWNRLELKDGVLFRRYVDRGTEGYQLVLPEKYRAKALEGVHDEVGHLGFERALNLARARFY